MQWLVDPSVRHQASRGVAWARAFLGQFDTSKVDWVRIDRGRDRSRLVTVTENGVAREVRFQGRAPMGTYGRCWYPERGRAKDRKMFRLSCQVAGPYPGLVVLRMPPIYFDISKGEHAPTTPPPGCQFGGYSTNHVTGRSWVSITRNLTLHTMDEAVVWIISHEAFHFLRKTRQVPGVNREIEADAYATAQLGLFRAAVGQ